jgi:hypothetical protein
MDDRNGLPDVLQEGRRGDTEARSDPPSDQAASSHRARERPGHPLPAGFCPCCGEHLVPGEDAGTAYCPVCEQALPGHLSSSRPLAGGYLPALIAWGLSPAAFFVICGILQDVSKPGWPFRSPLVCWLAFLGGPCILYAWSVFLLRRLPPLKWSHESRLEALSLTAVMAVVNLGAALFGLLLVGFLR